MCDQDHFEDDVKEYTERGLVTRRQFGALAAGAGLAFMLPAVANAQAVTETEVNIKTPDGTADAYFVHPASGQAPAVLIWPDILGLRPAFRQMGKRLAESGYSVLVVNPFYRSAKAPIAPGMQFAEGFKIAGPMAKLLNSTTHVTDARAFIAWLDTQAEREQDPRDGHDGLLHGRPDGRAHGGRVRSHPRRGNVPQRRAGGGEPGQPAPGDSELEGVVPDCHGRERR